MKKPELKNIELIKASKAYAKLKRDVTDAKILDRAYVYSVLLIPFSIMGMIASAYLIYLAKSPLAIIFFCIIFVLFSVQIAGLVHDSGHRAVFKSTLANDILGYFSCFLIVYTFSKWKVSHNKHHANPNEEGKDPDIDRPLIAFSEGQAKSKKGILRKLVKIQAYLYYPVGSLTVLYAQISGFYYFAKDVKKIRVFESIFFLIGIFIWLVLPILIFSPLKVFLIYVTVYPLFGLYLFNIFAPNHKGMPQVKKGDKLSFLEQQVMTARNVRGGFFTDFLLVGLNYQIEHHLFPNCPRNKLKLITPFVKKTCRDLGLEYTEVGFVETNKIILKELNSVSAGI